MSKEIRVGIVILVAAGILLVAIFMVGDQEGLWAEKYSLYVKYESVHGLQAGSPVRLNGLMVGSVESIRFSEDEFGKMVVKVNINESVKSFIRTDSKARISTMGLLGDKTIEITGGSDTATVLQQNEFIAAEKASSIEGIIAEAGDVVENLTDASYHAKEIIRKINEGEGSLGLFVNDPNVYFDLDKLLTLTETLVAQLESGEGSFTKFLTDSTFYVEMRDLLTNTNDLFDTLQTGSGTLAMLMRDPEPFHDIKQITENLRKLSTDLSEGEGTLGALFTDDSLYINLSRTMDRAEALFEDLRNNPGRYLKFSVF